MRKLRKKSKRPRTPWNLEQIKKERKILIEYGLRRKREIRTAEEILRKFRQRARDLIAVQNEDEKRTLLEKLKKLGLIMNKDPTLDDVLALSVKDILERRLQTIVYRKGLSRSIKHSRQMITHGHIMINGRRIPFPSYLVPAEEEAKIELCLGDKTVKR